jgi:hypothetical protein
MVVPRKNKIFDLSHFMTSEISAPPKCELAQPVSTIWILLAIAAVVFISHFLLCSKFGIYEDDYIYVLPTFNWSSIDWLHAVTGDLLNPPQGRPLYYLFQHTLSFLTTHGGDTVGGYLVSFVIVTINGFLMFRLLRKVLSPFAGFIGAMTLILFPIDTSRQVLMHQAALLLPMTILLIALDRYVGGRKVVAFVLAGTLLLIYESFYLPFLIAPLLTWESSRRMIRRCAEHLVVFFLIAGGVFFLRGLFGEERARSTVENLSSIVPKVLTACTLGPINAGSALFLRPIDAILHSDVFEWFVLVCVALLTAFILRKLPSAPLTIAQIDVQSDRESYRHFRTRILIALVAGLLAWSISYLLAFRPDYFPPLVSIGRLTAVHTVGAVGGGIFVSAVFQLIVGKVKQGILRTALFSTSALIFGGMSAFAVHVQRAEYVADWAKQQQFWRNLTADIRDVVDGDVIIVELSSDPDAMPVTQGEPAFGEVNYPPLALPYFIEFPPTWKQVPRVYGYWAQCEYEDTDKGRKLHTPPWFPAIWPVISDGRFIYFKVEQKRLVRVSESLNVGGKNFKPRPKPLQTLPPLRTTGVFDSLFRERGSDRWFSLKNARNYPQ